MGINETRFELQPVSDEFKCPICLGVLEDPLATRQCDHLFCSVCIRHCVDVTNKCAVCRQTLDSDDLIAPFRPFRNLMDKLRVQCLYEPCTVVVELQHLEQHQTNCATNPDNYTNEPIYCPNCGARFLEADIEQHNCNNLLSKQILSLTIDKSKLEEENHGYRQQIDKLDEKLRKRILFNIQDLKSLQTIQNVYLHTKHERDKLNAELRTIRDENLILKHEKDELSAELSAIRDENLITKQERDELSAELQTILDKNLILKHEKDELSAELQTILDKNLILKHEKDELSAELSAIREELKKQPKQSKPNNSNKFQLDTANISRETSVSPPRRSVLQSSEFRKNQQQTRKDNNNQNNVGTNKNGIQNFVRSSNRKLGSWFQKSRTKNQEE